MAEAPFPEIQAFGIEGVAFPVAGPVKQASVRDAHHMKVNP
ncbi:MAG: hypothetical protein M0Z56_12440 [Desulfobacteraceae bacterium]|nr:hypothetical protein [Desulfobacteraceae bacterium]